MRRAMACDFSWHEAARAYQSLYRRLLGDSH
jgi:glycogen synthase